MKTFIEVTFQIIPFNEEFCDILSAELAELGFDNFIITDDGLQAYIIKENFNEPEIQNIFLLKNNPSISYTTKEIIEENWNQKWEEDYNYIELDNCIVIAPFHKNYPSKKYEVLISPKMSFGTGHHATTFMMLDFLLNENLTKKKVLDMGCGTGVLAILASKLGATKITAIDIDEWAFENTLENLDLNEIHNIEVKKGNKSLLGNEKFDVILANINRNILLEDIPSYANVLNSKGKLFLSGFYVSDVEIIKSKAKENKLEFNEKKERNNWCALSFTKD